MANQKSLPVETNLKLKQFLEASQKQVDTALDTFLPEPSIRPQRLHEAMRYATFNGGKRIRPLLVYATGAALQVNSKWLDAPAAAVELIHAYSLVHDDLPAMDNDDLRRGKPTCHIQYDEATAVLVGDALQTLAFKTLTKYPHSDIPAPKKVEMLNCLAVASGSRGMAGGQALDLDAIGKQLNLAELENMHIHKTGALIRASVQLSSILATPEDETKLKGLDHYAKCIGLAFQVQDDILDVEGSTAELGKTQGKDEANHKPTYPSLLGLSGAKRMATRLHQEALDSLVKFDNKADPLRWLADYIVQRTH
jgi:farnesyl diphosphate synthase